MAVARQPVVVVDEIELLVTVDEDDCEVVEVVEVEDGRGKVWVVTCVETAIDVDGGTA